MYTYFVINYFTNPDNASYRISFYYRCQEEYKKREQLINGTEQDQARLRGLAMFMAEIFLNVEVCCIFMC